MRMSFYEQWVRFHPHMVLQWICRTYVTDHLNQSEMIEEAKDKQTFDK